MHDDDQPVTSSIRDAHLDLASGFREVIRKKLKTANKMTLPNLEHLLEIADKVHTFEICAHDTDSIIKRRQKHQEALAAEFENEDFEE